MRARLNVAAIFIAVGLGAVTVGLVHDPGALVPRPPYVQWVFAFFAVAALGMILVLGLEDDFAAIDDAGGASDRPIHWRAIALAYLTSVLASATFVGASALVTYLDRVFA